MESLITSDIETMGISPRILGNLEYLDQCSRLSKYLRVDLKLF